MILAVFLSSRGPQKHPAQDHRNRFRNTGGRSSPQPNPTTRGHTHWPFSLRTRRTALEWVRTAKVRLRHTTRHQHLPEKVTIVRTRHPFEGQSLHVFGAMHRKGRLLLVLILPDGSKSLVPADWTDLASPTHTLAAPTATTLGSLDNLLHARAVVDALLGRLASVTGEDRNSTKESALARNQSKPLRSSPRRNLSLGNAARATQKPRHPDPGTAHRSGRSG